MRSFLTTAFLLALSLLAFAQEDQSAIIAKWYAALSSIDRSTFETLISDKAVIKLEDIGVEQTKAEFIESLDEWEDAMKGATIRHQVISQSGNAISMRVCYTFSGNQSLNHEDFKIEAGMVVESVQAKVADSCAGFFP
jgi:hypothetical protein